MVPYFAFLFKLWLTFRGQKRDKNIKGVKIIHFVYFFHVFYSKTFHIFIFWHLEVCIFSILEKISNKWQILAKKGRFDVTKI